jgi:hypothetical protein
MVLLYGFGQSYLAYKLEPTTTTCFPVSTRTSIDGDNFLFFAAVTLNLITYTEKGR